VRIRDCASKRALTVTGRGACNLLRNGYPYSERDTESGRCDARSSRTRVCVHARAYARAMEGRGPSPCLYTARRGSHVTARQSARRRDFGLRARKPRADAISAGEIARANAQLHESLLFKANVGRMSSSRGIDLRHSLSLSFTRFNVQCPSVAFFMRRDRGGSSASARIASA